MKNLITLMLFVMTPFLLTAEESYTNLSGYFVDKRAKELFQVEVYHNKILIKAQNSRRFGWNTYYRQRGNKFRDGHGNLIYVKNSRKLYWKSRRGHNKKVLKRLKKSHFKKKKGHNCDVEGCFYTDNNRHHDTDWYRYGNYNETGYGYDNDNWNRHGHYYDDWDRYDNSDYYRDRDRNRNRDRDRYRNDGRYDDRYDNRYNNRNNGRRNGNDNNRNRSNQYGCQGDWRMVGTGQTISIRQDVDGLVAQMPEGDFEWVDLTKSMLTENYYWDPKGNAYVLKKDGTLEWKHRFGSKTYKFQRI